MERVVLAFVFISVISLLKLQPSTCSIIGTDTLGDELKSYS